MRRPGALIVGLALTLALAACTSPEATRVRAGGPGADVGNRQPVVRMHDGARPYWRTPNLLAGLPGEADRARRADTPAALPR